MSTKEEIITILALRLIQYSNGGSRLMVTVDGGARPISTRPGAKNLYKSSALEGEIQTF